MTSPCAAVLRHLHKLYASNSTLPSNNSSTQEDKDTGTSDTPRHGFRFATIARGRQSGPGTPEHVLHCVYQA